MNERSDQSSSADATPASLDTPMPVAVITGAARGIGAAVARELAADGWGLVLTDSCGSEPTLSYSLATRAELEEVAADCGENAVAFVADTRDQAALNAAVGIAVARFGGLSAAIACAGVMAGGKPAWWTTDEAWKLQMDVNLNGPWRLARAAVPALLDQPIPRRGRFVVVASSAVASGHPNIAAYAAAKSGVIGLVRSMAVELATEGVTVNAVCPGSTDTAMLAASAEIYGLRSSVDFGRQQPIHRLIEPAEIASAVGWLCSAGASAITGSVLTVDGGMTIA